MQQIMYQQTPWIVLAYPDYLEAYNTARWTGWQQMFDGSGPAFYAEGYIGSYLTCGRGPRRPPAAARAAPC